MRAALLIAALALAACAGGREVPAPAPSPLPAAEPPPAVTMPSLRIHTLRACLVQNGALTEVTFSYDILTGDSLYQGVPFSQAFPLHDGYAAEARWFIDNEPIPFTRPWAHVKYGYPRVMGVHEIVRAGEHRGVGIYVAVGDTVDPQVIYVPVRPGCLFQRYQINI